MISKIEKPLSANKPTKPKIEYIFEQESQDRSNTDLDLSQMQTEVK